MSQATPTAAPLTVVLVHGAFADASGWNDVAGRLQADGVPVTAPANPLRGISIDSAHIASVLDQIPGPVLAVGHSYGGAVITNAANIATNVVGLVYVAGFAPEEGERLIDAESTSRDSVLNAALIPLHYPSGRAAETAVEFAIDPAQFHDAFAADLPVAQTAVMAATQAPSPSWRSPSPPGRPVGRTSPPGRWSRPAIRPPVLMSSGRWLSAPGQRSSRSRAPT
jgi:pimeloyl-ACP methyl ester carboxylesterase